MRPDTRQALLLLRGLIVLLAVLTPLFATLAYTEVHNTAAAAGERAVPVLRELATARTALLSADREGMRSFRSQAVELIGAGDGHRDQLAVATQSLTRVAGLNLAGAAGSRQLQLVVSELATYASAMEQAATQYRLPGSGPVLGTADLWRASRLLHEQGGVLAQLDEVRTLQWRAFEQSVDESAPTLLRTLSWLVPGLALLRLLVFAQVYLARRFRRRVNLWLAGACVLVAGLLGLTTVAFGSQQRLDAAEIGLERLKQERAAHDAEISAEGQRWLVELLRRQCPDLSGCGPTVREFVARTRFTPDGPEEATLTERAGQLDGQVREVGGRGDLWPALPAGAAVVITLVLLGFRPRMAEFRTRARR